MQIYTNERATKKPTNFVRGTVLLLSAVFLLAGCQSTPVIRSDDLRAETTSRRTDLITVDRLARNLDMRVKRSSPYSASLEGSGNHLLILGPPTDRVTLNGRRIPAIEVESRSGSLFVSRGLENEIERMLGPAIAPVPLPKPKLPVTGTVMIDAGHGGRDPGAPNNWGPPEKDITLDVALRVQHILNQSGVRTIMTRQADIYPSLDDRVNLSNRLQPNLFVSIHADAAKNTAAQGATVYIAKKASTESLVAANAISQSMLSTGAPSRGVRRANYRVVAKTQNPAVLVELGYLSNAEEARRLSTPAYRHQCAQAVANGVIEALRTTNRMQTASAAK